MFPPLYQPPFLLRSLYGKQMLWRKEPNKKIVYLTFDDGPTPIITNEILKILQSFNVRATFFLVGQNAEIHQDIYHSILEAGHHTGNHTFSHLNGWNTTTVHYIKNIKKADKILNNTRLFRPPYGKLKPQQKKYLIQQNYTICMWDVLTHDYDQHYNDTDILNIVKRFVRNGSIINFHDSKKAKKNVLKTLPYCIDFLLHEEYSLQLL